DLNRLAIHQHSAGIEAIDAEKRAAEFRPAGADEARHPDNFACAQGKRDAGKIALPRGHALHAQPLLARRHRVALINLYHLAAYHVANDAVRGDFSEVSGINGIAVAQDGDAISHGPQLLQPVSDVNHSHSALPESLHDAEYLLGFGTRQRG